VSELVLFVAGSPSESSRSTLVARRVAEELTSSGIAARFVSLRDFDAADVLLGRTTQPEVARFVEASRAAAAVVLATPVYKATYAGGLKALVDLIPPDALDGKPALAIATTKLAAHGALAASAFDALFTFFAAKRAAETLVVLDAEIRTDGEAPAFAPDAEAHISRAADALRRAIIARR
jgi:FMN reductase